MAEPDRGEASLERYAIVVVVDAASAGAACEAVCGAAGSLEGGGEPD